MAQILPNMIQIVTEAKTLKASAAVTKYRFVTYAGAHCGAAGFAAGVSYFDAAIGDPITVYGPGNIVPIEASTAITIGAIVTSDANGKAVTATVLDATHSVMAICCQAAVATGDIVSCLLL